MAGEFSGDGASPEAQSRMAAEGQFLTSAQWCHDGLIAGTFVAI
jgi:hypothetical protein